MDTPITRDNPTNKMLSASLLVGMIVTAFYVYVYWWQPFAAPWDDVVINHIISLSAGLAAVILTLIWRQFAADEPPKAVWGYFAVGMWGWAIAEEMWALYALFVEDVPAVSPADLPWLLAFVFFGISLLRQFQIIYSLNRKQHISWFVGVTLVVLAATFIATVLFFRSGGESEQSWFETFILNFYPFGDLALALAALRLSQIFGRGAWGRAWWGLLAFVISDSFYTYLNFSGLYAVSVEEGNSLSLFADTLYMAAYLLLAFGCYAQLLLIQHGPTVSRSHQDETASQIGI